MRVAVLCGGKGTRLGEPIKCLAEVAGRPFMDWKIDQLHGQGATRIMLLCGPYQDEFSERYSHRLGVTVHSDEQIGVEPALRHVATPDWWTWGDTLIHIGRLHTPTLPTMYVRRDPANANIAGIYLDVGLYSDTGNFTLVETTAVPHHINTPADRDETDAYLRRYGLFG